MVITMFKKQKQKEKPQKPSDPYHLFVGYSGQKNWIYEGEYSTKEDCERDMIETGEPEGTKYLVIRGKLLETIDGTAIYPTNIIEDNNE